MYHRRKKSFQIKDVRKVITPFLKKAASWLLAQKKHLKYVPPRSLATPLIIVGVVLIAIPQAFKSTTASSPNTTPEATVTPEAKDHLTGPIKIDQQLLGSQEITQPPLRIIVPKYDIDLSIVEAGIVNGEWELSETTASHGVGSASPGQVGNMVIFAHARAGLFLPLRDIQKDEIVYVLTKDRWHRYRVVDSKLVNPDQVEVISPSTEEKLTLFTCSGFLDSKRLIVSAVPYRP